MKHILTVERSTIMALAVPIFLSLFLVLSSTHYLADKVSVYDAKRLLQMAILHLIILTALLDKGLRSGFTTQLAELPPLIGKGLLIFFGLGIMSSLTNSDSLFSLAYSLIEVYMLGLLAVVVLIVAACRSKAGRKFDKLTISFVILLGLSVGAQELVGVAVAWSTGHQFSYDIALTHFAHPRFYNQLQSWTIPVIVVLPILFPRHRLATVVVLTVLCLHWYIILMTGARGSALSLLTALASMAVFFPASRYVIIKWQLAGLTLGVALYASMLLGPETGWEPLAASTILPHVTDNTEIQNSAAESDSVKWPNDYGKSNPFYDLSLGRPMLHSSGRLDLWKAAFRSAADKPLFGMGPMNFACKGPLGRVGHPHNFPLQIASEWGIPALIIVIMIVAVVMLRLIERLRRPCTEKEIQQRQMQTLLATGILAAGMHACLSGVLMTPASQATAILVCGWLLGTFSAKKPKPQPRKRNIFAILTLFLVLSAGAVYWPFAIQQVKNMTLHKQRLPVIEQALPRYWQLGKACYQSASKGSE